ncbi:hypothetical protein CONCODRAFT_13252 [Conidiobolus coronatus NRRL 28638]|uniref:Uncharacterized protein n=1 Tax=Conidiobolus coronatus (strain ATCC 28846 / CBS 209.66 / NRRL 28638) TaxID=796925 RepID=A0A137NR41_CONC2|nr:hypothetical protein CONCODRAFT_13252 [Conidiobolus coronatus NRRL 28638]|eukprot:KXN65236.1 hypothetical protein CONCODRAFT_13252 [Conidiobolus coronatus NRRL 28638]
MITIYLVEALAIILIQILNDFVGIYYYELIDRTPIPGGKTNLPNPPTIVPMLPAP